MHETAFTSILHTCHMFLSTPHCTHKCVIGFKKPYIRSHFIGKVENDDIWKASSKVWGHAADLPRVRLRNVLLQGRHNGCYCLMHPFWNSGADNKGGKSMSGSECSHCQHNWKINNWTTQCSPTQTLDCLLIQGWYNVLILNFVLAKKLAFKLDWCISHLWLCDDYSSLLFVRHHW